MSYLINTCDCSGKVFYHACQSTTCGFDPSGNLQEGSKWNAPGNVAINQKRIWNQVRAPSSVYTMNLGALTVNGNNNNQPTVATNYVNWNQMSDRVNPHTMQFQNHPSRGNSTKRTLTSIKPGACTPGGTGVDIKHGSYARYLARKKAGNIRTQSDYSAASTPKYGNKTKMYGMIANSENCPCTLDGVTDLATIINNLRSFFENSPQYEDYTLCLAGEKETIAGDIGNGIAAHPDLSVGDFKHLYAGQTVYDSINYASIKNMINTVNVACSDVIGHDALGKDLGTHTLALIKSDEVSDLSTASYGNTYWPTSMSEGLRVYGSTFTITCYISSTVAANESSPSGDWSGPYYLKYSSSSTHEITYSTGVDSSGTAYQLEAGSTTSEGDYEGAIIGDLYYIFTTEGNASKNYIALLDSDNMSNDNTYTPPSTHKGMLWSSDLNYVNTGLIGGYSNVFAVNAFNDTSPEIKNSAGDARFICCLYKSDQT